MNANVPVPYSPTCSRPQMPELAFFSPRSDTLLFTGVRTIELYCQAGVRAVALQWTLTRNGFTTPFRLGTAEPLLANRFRISLPTEGLHPGFYDLHVTLDDGTGTPRTGVCTFGYRGGHQRVHQSRPADFRAFWARAKAAMDALPLDAVAEAPTLFTSPEIDAYNLASASLPGNYDPAGIVTDDVESGKVSFAGPDGGRVHGWLAKPAGPGPFPAMLVLPGAGIGPRPRPLEQARHGYLALDIQAHGQDVDLPEYPILPGYYDGHIFDPVDAYYYYRIHQRVVQAVRYLASRPDVDPARIAVVGGSQGGRLGMVAAALDPRVSAVVSCIAHSGHLPYHYWAQASNAAGADGMDSAAPQPADTPEARCLRYYDPMNFAPDVHCPVLMNAGLIDPTSPPACVFAIYRNLGTRRKEIEALPGLGHDWSAEFERRAWHWLAAQWARP